MPVKASVSSTIIIETIHTGKVGLGVWRERSLVRTLAQKAHDNVMVFSPMIV